MLDGYDQGEHDNENVTVLPDHLFTRSGRVEDDTETQDEDTLRPWVDPHGLKKIDGIWWKDEQRVVTSNMEGRRQLVHNHHDLPTYGHPGIARTIELTSRQYWWP